MNEFPYNSLLEINLSAITHNFNTISETVPANVKKLAVVKANAYGLGAVPITRYLKKADWFATATVAEAVELRNAGIEQPILILSTPHFKLAEWYQRYDLTATISSLEHFKLLLPGTKAHINFDTGMFRLGFLPTQLEDVLKEVQKSNLRIDGIYTHFANSFNPNEESVYHQFEVFQSIRSHFPKDWLAHSACSGAVAFYPETCMDMIRIGISLYSKDFGGTPIPNLKSVASWKTEIVQCKAINKGTKVGYGWSFEALEDGFISIIPVGYADGVKRLLGNKLKVRIGQELIQVVGRITMDYTHLFSKKAYSVGTEVEILGSHPENSLANWAEMAQTSPYEILTSIGTNRVKRIYIE